MRRLLAALLAASLAACDGTETSTCVDETKRRVCEGDDCVERSCRGDEWCEAGACAKWSAAALWADFVAEPGPGTRVTFRVLDGGFPRDFAELIRFDFGDGIAGFGEESTHRYAAGGVYAVRMEVVLEGLRVLRASRLVTVEPAAPVREPASITVNAFPDYLNGSQPLKSNAFTPDDPRDDYEERFHVLLPAHGFTVDVTLLDAPGGEVNRDSISLVADVALGAGRVPAGTNVADRLRFEAGATMRAPRATWSVSEEDAFPDGDVTLTLRASLADGTPVEDVLSFEVRALTPVTDPFDAPMSWLVRFDMDRFTVEGGPGPNGTIGMAARLGSNGEPDFVEELRLFGAQGGESAPGAATVVAGRHVGANAIYLARVKRRAIEAIRRVFLMAPDGTPRDGIAFGLYADGEPGAPDPLLFDPSGTFSIMRIGGVLDEALGRSMVSWYNAERSDDTTDELGVASTSLLGLAAGTSLLREAFDPLKPGLGTPVGEDPLDALVLSDRFDRWDPANAPEANDRHDALEQVAQLVGLTLAPVVAHEMGHAMGLMPSGAPPWGLFANRGDVSFIDAAGTDDAHVNFPGLNVMQAGGNPVGLVGEIAASTELPAGLDALGLYRIVTRELRLSPYERAYLQRRLTHY